MPPEFPMLQITRNDGISSAISGCLVSPAQLNSQCHGHRKSGVLPLRKT